MKELASQDYQPATEDSSAARPAVKDCLTVAPPLQAPEGWKLVPVEPTLTMRAAGKMEQNRYTGMDPLLPLAVYRAMLAAAPALPTPEPDVCGHCGQSAPGCGGLFASDGKACKFHGGEGTKP